MIERSKQKQAAFTLVEVLVVVIVLSILTTITVVSFGNVQSRARDGDRIANLKAIANAIERYKFDNGRYPPIDDGSSTETTCGSQTENWGHCDRMKALADYLDPYMKIDPVSLSSATEGTLGYYYNSNGAAGYQTYGMYVILEGNGGANDSGYYSNAYEVGKDPEYCMNKYTGASARWGWSGNNARCIGGL